MTRRQRVGVEDGSSIVDFALVGAVLSLLFAALVQLGIALYAHNMLVSCAAEGARYGARADHQPSDAVAATKERIAETLNAAYAEDVTAREEVVNGVRTVVVRVRAPVPLFGLFGPSRVLTATGHAFSERQ